MIIILIHGTVQKKVIIIIIFFYHKPLYLYHKVAALLWPDWLVEVSALASCLDGGWPFLPVINEGTCWCVKLQVQKI